MEGSITTVNTNNTNGGLNQTELNTMEREINKYSVPQTKEELTSILTLYYRLLVDTKN